MDPPLCGSTTMSHNEFTISEPMEPQEASPMKHEINVLGIDIAKRVFHAVGMDNTGKIVYRKRLSRHDLMPQCSDYACFLLRGVPDYAIHTRGLSAIVGRNALHGKR